MPLVISHLSVLPFALSPIKLKKAMGTDMEIQTENISGIVHFIRGEKAILVNIAIMRAFVQLRKFMETNKELVLYCTLMKMRSNFRLDAVMPVGTGAQYLQPCCGPV